MIAITGARGVGKTTLMLQHQVLGLEKESRSLYVSLDHPYFFDHSLLSLAEQFYKEGGRFLFIDEVHKFPNWSRELKMIYDLFPTLKTVFSASSALEIFKGESDLSRRVMIYHLHGLSFREYLSYQLKITFEAYTLQEIIQNHETIVRSLMSELEERVLRLFKEYLEWGYYPFALELNKKESQIRINQVINVILDTDMAYAEGYTAATAHKLKKLLAVLAETVPFQPNVSELARKLGIARDTIYQYLKLLERGLLISPLYAQGKGISLFQKPEKLFLENTNLAFALQNYPDLGNLRETFFFNQLRNAGKEVLYPKSGDFLIDGQLFEIGGKSKNKKQIAQEASAFVVADDILIGYQNKIPLWLFGFLY
ncbi:ATP-binding protein [Algoriphagus algorifonticola]|uniref:ATP-binding protein n=1 Tax=Algoriphagus algorifonticola TaxID=2593007 RepID=UPI0020230EC7|nr:AAA family ATPase [Algoriphagus algorifonticola]